MERVVSKAEAYREAFAQYTDLTKQVFKLREDLYELEEKQRKAEQVKSRTQRELLEEAQH